NADIIRAALRFASPVSDLAAACFPFPAPGDPERERDQLHVETEAGALEIQPIEPELARERDVAGREDLRETGQARTNRMALAIAGNLRERRHPSVAAHFDFARTQRPRTHEAHVAREDVHELGQFI